MTATPAVLLVDGMSIFKTTAGPVSHLNRGFIYSFLSSLTATMKRVKPASVIVCWEGGLGGRQEHDPNYKSSRTSTSDAIREQRDELQKLLPHLGVEQAWCPGYEADDVIASLANTLPVPVVIYSNDKDFLQLVSERIHVYRKPLVQGSKTRVVVTPMNFEEATGYRNSSLWRKGQFALGDAVDEVAKVPGCTPAKVHAFLHDMHVGPKTAEFLTEVFSGANADYQRNVKLMDLRGIRELSEPLKITYGKLSAENAVRILYEMEFASIVAKFHDWFAVYEGAAHADVSD